MIKFSHSYHNPYWRTWIQKALVPLLNSLLEIICWCPTLPYLARALLYRPKNTKHSLFTNVSLHHTYFLLVLFHRYGPDLTTDGRKRCLRHAPLGYSPPSSTIKKNGTDLKAPRRKVIQHPKAKKARRVDGMRQVGGIGAP